MIPTRLRPFSLCRLSTSSSTKHLLDLRLRLGLSLQLRLGLLSPLFLARSSPFCSVQGPTRGHLLRRCEETSWDAEGIVVVLRETRRNTNPRVPRGSRTSRPRQKGRNVRVGSHVTDPVYRCLHLTPNLSTHLFLLYLTFHPRTDL